MRNARCTYMSFRVYSVPRAVICPCASNGPDGARVRDKRLRSCKALRHGRHGYAKFNSPVKSNITRARSRVWDFCKNRVTFRGRVRSSHTHLSLSIPDGFSNETISSSLSSNESGDDNSRCRECDDKMR